MALHTIDANLNDGVLPLLKTHEYSPHQKKSLLSSNVVLSFVGKIPLPKKTIKFYMPHRPLGISVCVIVKDIRKTDFEASGSIWKSMWQKNLSKHGTVSLPPVTFLPISELKLAYQSFEARRKLAATFDVFLADKRVIHHLPTNLGKAFYGRNTNKVPVPVSLAGKDLVTAVQSVLTSGLALIKGNGSTESFVVGDTDMPAEHLKENILSVANDILAKWPGGLKTLRSIYVRGAGPSIPLYFDETEVPQEAAVEALESLRKTPSTPIHNFLPNRGGVSPELRLLSKHLANNSPKLPVAAILEAAKSLPLSDVDVGGLFSNTSYIATKLKSKKKIVSKRQKNSVTRKNVKRKFSRK
uniref:Ribosomal L1 domain-containing protein 1 n=1 Tax=Schistocephalus solidus TaxID=70667 RepID=A0A0X3PMI8_SCHSO